MDIIFPYARISRDVAKREKNVPVITFFRRRDELFQKEGGENERNEHKMGLPITHLPPPPPPPSHPHNVKLFATLEDVKWRMLGAEL